MLKTFCVLIVGVICVNAAVVKLPDDVPVCNVKEANKNECLKSAIITGIKKLKSGNKKLGLLSLDPLHVDEVALDLGTGTAPFLFTARNVDVYGLSESVLTDVDFEAEKFAFQFKTLTPNATFTFDYEANGRLLVLPVQGAGPGSFHFTDMVATHKIVGAPLEKDGRLHLDVKEFNIEVDGKKLDIHLEGLFKGNKQVSDQISEFLKREWRVFLDQLRGPAGVAFGQIFKDLANRVFHRVPYNDVFVGADELVQKSKS